MIAMQYTIHLAEDYGVELVHDRVRRRHALFDGMAGLIHKSYLFNTAQCLYAPFYVWNNEDAAREFLTSALFQDVIQTFGRPRVRCWNIIAYTGCPEAGTPQVAVKELDSIAAEEDLGELCERERQHHQRSIGTKGLCFHLTGLDPDRWELMRYSVWCDASQVRYCDSDSVETFDILHLTLSKPVA